MEKIQSRRVTISEFLASRKLAITLLTILILLSILGTVIPQESLYPRDDFKIWQSKYPLLSNLAISLGLAHLYTSLGYITVIGMLFLSISVCTYRRALWMFRDTKRELPDVSVLKRYKNFFFLNYPYSIDESCKIIRSNLLRRGYRLSNPNKEKDIRLKGEKGRYGIWGSLLFHFSFLIILAGALVSVWTRFEGKIILTEGQTFKGHPNEYIAVQRAPFFTPKPLGFQLALQKFKPLYGTVPKYISEVLIEEDNGEGNSETIRDFHALSYKGYTFYQKGHGFSPSFVLKDPRGRVIFQSFVAFKSHWEAEEVRYEDYLRIPGTGFEVEGRLYPDMVINDGKIKTKSPLPNNPVVEVNIKKWGKKVYQGAIKLDQGIKLGDFLFSFNDLRYWSGFRVVKDPGIPIIYAGFCAGVLGLIIRILLIHEYIWVFIEGNAEGSTLIIAGRAERGKAFFAERFAGLVEELKGV